MTVAAYTLVPALGIGAAITNLNATPSVRASGGQGGIYTPIMVEGFAVAPINMPITNFLPLVRIPSNAIVKKVEIMADSYPSTSLTFDVGLTFSNGGSGATVGASPVSGLTDGTSQANLSVYSTTAQTSALSQVVSFTFFADAYAFSTTIPVNGITDVTFHTATTGGGTGVTDGFYVPSASMKPLWQAISAGGIGGLGKATGATSTTVGNGFTSCATDPFGFFDVCIAASTVGTNTGAVNVGLRVTYALPAQ